MRFAIIVVAAVVAIGSSLLLVRVKHAQQRQQVALQVAKATAEQAASEAREHEAAKARAEREQQKLIKLTQEMGAELDRRTQEATNGLQPKAAEPVRTNAANFGAALAGMMKDPETRKFMQAQQRMVLDSMYASLIRQLGLSKEHGEQLKDFLAEQAMKAAERAMSVMSGQGGASRAEQWKELAEQQKQAEQQIKEFLGDEKYAQYQEYQLTLQERAQLNMFRQQNGGQNPMSDGQTEQLLALIKQEKSAVAAETGIAFATGQNATSMESMLSEERMEKLISAQETVNERVLKRATQLLEPEQLTYLASFQTNQIQTMRMGMAMARKMFGEQR